MLNNLYEYFTIPLLEWYHKSKRDLPWRRTKDPYAVWVSEIMLQQTRVEAVIPYYHRWLERFPTVEVLAEAPVEEVLKYWEGLGYYRRARYLHEGAKMVAAEGWPADAASWRNIKGVGDYTAGAIASITLGERVPAVDGNVLRVMARFLGYEGNVLEGEAKKVVTEALRPLLPLAEEMGDFTQALIELGAILCTPKGFIDCEHCPLGKACYAKTHHLQAMLPVRISKTKIQEVEKTVLMVMAGHKWAVEQRGEDGLLAGLWQFPLILGHREPEEAQAYLEDLGFVVEDVVPGPRHKAVFSHRVWQLASVVARVKEEGEPYRWVDLQALEEDYPMASAVREYQKVMEAGEDYFPQKS